jgi:hypothetical protein
MKAGRSVARIPYKTLRSNATCAGAALCDKRRDIAIAEEQFPGVDFSHIERGDDLVYKQHKVESEHAVMERGARFLQWIMARCPLGSKGFTTQH